MVGAVKRLLMAVSWRRAAKQDRPTTRNEPESAISAFFMLVGGVVVSGRVKTWCRLHIRTLAARLGPNQTEPWVFMLILLNTYQCPSIDKRG